MSGVFPPDFDAPRAMPDRLRANLLDDLADAALIRGLQDVDAPRPLSAGLTARLEATLVAPGRDLPAGLRRRIERALPTRRRIALPLTIAASILLILGMVSLPLVANSTSHRDDPVAAPSPSRDGGDGAAQPTGGDASAGAGAAGTGSGGQEGPSSAPPSATDQSPAAPGGINTGTGTSGGGAAGGWAVSPPSEPPPFAYEGFAASAPLSAAPGGGHGGRASPPPPLRIGVAGSGGDSDAEAGLRAYVRLVNETGGIRGRRIELRATSESAPAAGTLGVVNVGSEPLAGEAGPPSWVDGPLLEPLAVPEALLTGRVFSFGSALERQARLAVASALPDEVAPGTTAVVYRSETSGPYGERVPAALSDALEARGVLVIMATVDPGDPTLVPADAAFVSLASDSAGAFLDAVARAGYSPGRGLWGVASLFDEDLADLIEDRAAVLSPYAPASDDEMRALRERSARPVSAESVHGWVAAKALAVAAYEAEPHTPSAMTAALAALGGWTTGFIPPYEVRSETRARTPEAIVLEVVDGRFRSKGEFLRDAS